MKDIIKPPTGLLCNGNINPAGVMNNTPVFYWKHSGNGTEKGYRVLVASSVEAIQNDIGDMWDTGYVWQWDFNGGL